MSSYSNNSDTENNGEKSIGGSEPGFEWGETGYGWGEAPPKAPWRQRLVDSFRQDPDSHITNIATEEARPKFGFDHKGAAERTANSGLAHKLKSRHMQMIAIGGSIGKFRSGWSGVVLTYPVRYWFVRHVRCCSLCRRPRFSDHRLWYYRNPHVLHRAGLG